MSVTNAGLLRRDHFAGSGKVFGVGSDKLVTQQRTLMEKAVRERFAQRNLLNLVDNSAGLAGMTFTSANATNISTCTLPAAGHGFKTGDGPFQLSSATDDLPSGLSELTDYWVTRLSATTFYICISKANAIAGTAAPLADDGTGTHKILAISGHELPAETDLTGETTGFSVATWDASVDSVSNALACLMDHANKLLALIGDGGTATTTFTVAASGTIPAVDIDVADNTVDTDATNMVSCRAGIIEMDAELRDVIEATSRVRVAVGLSAVAEGSLTRKVAEDTGWNLNGGSANTNGVATTAGASGTITTAPLQAAVEKNLSTYRDNVALLVVLLDEVTNRTAVVDTIVEGVVPQTEYAAGTSIFVTAPVSGRITKVESIVIDEITTGLGAITFEIGGSAVSGAALGPADGAIIGEYDVDAVADTQVAGPPKVATGNYVNKGDQIEIVGDGTPTAGALLVKIHIKETGEDLTDNPIIPVFAGV